MANMKYSYAAEKTMTAVHSLAVGRGRIRERLIDAVMFSFIHVPGEVLPPDLRTEYKNLMASLTARKAVGSEGTITATVEHMSEDDAVQFARRIVELEDRVRSLYEGEDD